MMEIHRMKSQKVHQFSSKRPRDPTDPNRSAVSGQGTNAIGRENQPSGIVRCDIKRALKVWPRIHRIDDRTKKNAGDQWWPRATIYITNNGWCNWEGAWNASNMVDDSIKIHGFEWIWPWKLLEVAMNIGIQTIKMILQDSTIRFRDSTNKIGWQIPSNIIKQPLSNLAMEI